MGAALAPEVGSKVPFLPGGNQVPERVLIVGGGQERVEVMLDDGIEAGRRGAAWAVGGGTGRAAGGAGDQWRTAVLAGSGRSGERGGGLAPEDDSHWSGATPWRIGTGGVSGSNSAAPREETLFVTQVGVV